MNESCFVRNAETRTTTCESIVRVRCYHKDNTNAFFRIQRLKRRIDRITDLPTENLAYRSTTLREKPSSILSVRKRRAKSCILILGMENEYLDMH